MLFGLHTSLWPHPLAISAGKSFANGLGSTVSSFSAMIAVTVLLDHRVRRNSWCSQWAAHTVIDGENCGVFGKWRVPTRTLLCGRLIQCVVMAAGKRSKVQGRCALCKNIKELQKSRSLPAALYRRMRTENDANPNPVMMTRKQAARFALLDGSV